MAAQDENVMIQFSIHGNDVYVQIPQSLATFLTSPDTEPSMKRGMLEQLYKRERGDRDETSRESQQPSTSNQVKQEKSVKFWKEEEERILISVRGDMESVFTSGVKDHTQLWSTVAQKLTEEGILATITQIMNKWNQLKKKYRELKDHNSKTENDRKNWKYEREFDQLYGERAATKAEFTQDSLETETTPPSASDKDVPSAAKEKPSTKTKGTQRKRHSPSQLEIMQKMLKVAEDSKELQNQKMDRMDN